MRSVLFFGVMLGCAACGTALNYIQTASPPHKLSARGPGQVQVFMTGKPSRPYVEVGIVESQQEGLSVDDEQDVVDKMREYAGELGCDALVIFAGNDATKTFGGSDSTSSRSLKGYRGSCLVYTAARPAVVTSALMSPNACIPNATQLCYGPGGCRGAQRCTEDGKQYTLCDCGSADPQQSVTTNLR